MTSVVAEMDQALSVEQNNRQEFSLSNLLFADTQIKNTRRLTLCFVIQLFQQFTGINVIAFYGEMRHAPKAEYLELTFQ